MQATWRKQRPSTKRISIFCYPGAPLKQWLDDLGSTAPTSHQIDKLYELLDRRSQERKKTIVTTNMTYADIEEVFGKRLTRRLTDKVFTVNFKTK